MLHIVKPNDTLNGIASRFGTTDEAIMKANVLCNSNYLYVGQPLIIPEPSLYLPKAGGSPYYVVKYGDTLWCLARHFSESVESLGRANGLQDWNQIHPGMELLVTFEESANPEALFESWNNVNFSSYHKYFESFMNKDTFTWESFGLRAIPYLAQLLDHQNREVRYYSTKSLGRIGTGNDTFIALQKALNDSDEKVVTIARAGVKRAQLIPQWTKRVHVVTNEVKLFNEPNINLPSVSIAGGTPVIVLTWNIPDPAGETEEIIMAHTGPQVRIYDLVQIVDTGQIGYIPRDQWELTRNIWGI